VITYPAILDVPRELLTFLAALLAGERRKRGTRAGTRAPSCGKQALFALVWFRERRDVALTGKGLGISQATSYRYLDEAIDVLAARAPDLHDALQRSHDEGRSHVALDGKVVDTDRLRVKTLRTRSEIAPPPPDPTGAHTTRRPIAQHHPPRTQPRPQLGR